MVHRRETRANQERNEMIDGAVRPVALITGASSGIGATFARALSTRGYDLILVARREDRLHALAAELAAARGTGTEVLAADLANDADLRRVAARVAQTEQLELLVNNAGFGVTGRFWDSNVEAQEKMHRVHVLATMRLTHAALGGMTARRHGAIINVSSVAGFLQGPGSVTYSATKCWINSFTEGLHLELKSAGSPVKIQALCPGFTVTEFHDVTGVDRKSIPSRLWMRPEQVVEASLRGLDRGEVFVVPGRIYKWIVRLAPVVRLLMKSPAVLRRSRRREHY
jgi:short-subunit dehydrogenase